MRNELNREDGAHGNRRGEPDPPAARAHQLWNRSDSQWLGPAEQLHAPEPNQRHGLPARAQRVRQRLQQRVQSGLLHGGESGRFLQCQHEHER